MKILLTLMTLFSFSLSWAQLGGGDDPIPFPLRQSPEALVGRWSGTQIGDEIVIKLLQPQKDKKERLSISLYTAGKKSGQGYLYNSENKMYCGYIHHDGPMYTLCIWKQNEVLKSQTLEKTGEWRESLWTH